MGSISTPTAPSLEYHRAAQTEFKPPLIANENAFLGDVVTSEKHDAKAPISAGFFRLEKGTPLVYTYTYHETKIIVDGHFLITQENAEGSSGSAGDAPTIRATKGDVFYFPAGSRIRFETEDFGLGFYCGQRKEGGA